ncbi:MAG: MGMT family protein [Clostridiales bacterium]|nr:MGMT family protein [Clostridiales bacterium]
MSFCNFNNHNFLPFPNRLNYSVIILFHRVIGNNGDLVGYAGGLEMKKELLAAEHINSF